MEDAQNGCFIMKILWIWVVWGVSPSSETSIELVITVFRRTYISVFFESNIICWMFALLLLRYWLHCMYVGQNLILLKSLLPIYWMLQKRLIYELVYGMVVFASDVPMLRRPSLLELNLNSTMCSQVNLLPFNSYPHLPILFPSNHDGWWDHVWFSAIDIFEIGSWSYCDVYTCYIMILYLPEG